MSIRSWGLRSSRERTFVAIKCAVDATGTIRLSMISIGSAAATISASIREEAKSKSANSEGPRMEPGERLPIAPPFRAQPMPQPGTAWRAEIEPDLQPRDPWQWKSPDRDLGEARLGPGGNSQAADKRVSGVVLGQIVANLSKRRMKPGFIHSAGRLACPVRRHIRPRVAPIAIAKSLPRFRLQTRPESAGANSDA